LASDRQRAAVCYPCVRSPYRVDGTSRFAGFTLIELLVVIAIIAILASLSAGALSRAKGEGKKALCTGNFRQLQLAWQMYVDDNERHLPYNRGTLGVGEMEDWPNGLLAKWN
jgi:prepilin-type N-terminal cleavage/methylation domain-containing protein